MPNLAEPPKENGAGRTKKDYINFLLSKIREQDLKFKVLKEIIPKNLKYLKSLKFSTGLYPMLIF